MAEGVSFEELQDRIRRIKWYHSIRIGNVVTPGIAGEDHLAWTAQAIPENLHGKSVLDIGAWDGYFSFLCEKRGASRVLAIDDLSGPRSLGMEGNEGFQLAKKMLGSSVEFKQMSAYDVGALDQTFDLTIFFGVYYHLKNPLLALEVIYQRTGELLAIEGHVVDDPRPIMYFYDTFELNPGDASNWWGPSVSCLEKMLRRVGFRKIAVIDKKKDRALLQAWK